MALQRWVLEYLLAQEHPPGVEVQLSAGAFRRPLVAAQGLDP